MGRSCWCRGWFSPIPFSDPALARPTLYSPGSQSRAAGQSLPDPHALRQAALHFRELAAPISDEALRALILDVAAQYEAEAERLEVRSALGDSGLPR